MTNLPPITIWLRAQQERGAFRSVRDVTKKVGMSESTFQNILTGETTRPTPEVLAKLASFFHVPTGDLMTLAGYTTPADAVAAQVAGKSIDELVALVPEAYRPRLRLIARDEGYSLIGRYQMVQAGVADILRQKEEQNGAA